MEQAMKSMEQRLKEADGVEEGAAMRARLKQPHGRVCTVQSTGGVR